MQLREQFTTRKISPCVYATVGKKMSRLVATFVWFIANVWLIIKEQFHIYYWMFWSEVGLITHDWNLLWEKRIKCLFFGLVMRKFSLFKHDILIKESLLDTNPTWQQNHIVFLLFFSLFIALLDRTAYRDDRIHIELYSFIDTSHSNTSDLFQINASFWN